MDSGPRYFLGIDGGGSRCLGWIRDLKGKVLGEAVGGASSICQDFEGRWRRLPIRPGRRQETGWIMRRVKGRLELEDGTLAGSNLTMDEALRYVVKGLAVPVEEGLQMASLNPASLLRREHELGPIAPGYLASLVHLGDDLRVRQTWINGR